MNTWGDYMYRYSKRTIGLNFAFAAMLVFCTVVLSVDFWFRLVIGLMSVLIFRDAIKELYATFELKGDRMVVRFKEKTTKEILYKDMKYLTITRKNKKWIVIADDEGILFTIKPRIENHKTMVADLIRLNKSNKKLEVHDYIKKTYK